jgi:SET family sugar efflux transporter-like MFS transporter
MLRKRGADHAGRASADVPHDALAMTRTGVTLVVAAFIAMAATNSAAVSVMTLFVTRALHLDVFWAGLALGLAAALEIPALLLIGRLGHRLSDFTLIAIGCVAGIGYYLGMALVSGPVLLLTLQVLNAVFVAVVAGVGLSLFQLIIAKPGLAAGLYTNTRRVGAIVSGPVIGLASVPAFGYSGVFAACAVLTGVALAVIGVAGWATRRG